MTKLECTYLGEYPKDRHTGWSDKLQGVCHDADHWYFSQTLRIFRIPIAFDLNKAVNPDTLPHTGMPPELADLGFKHFGDFDCVDQVLHVPVEGGSHPIVALFTVDDNEITLMQWMTLTGQQQAPWCAVHPQSGAIYSSDFYQTDAGNTPSKVHVFTLNDTQDALDVKAHVTLRDETGNPIRVSRIQGGTFDPNGVLYLLSDVKGGGIMAFDVATGTRLCHTPISFNPGTLGDELEGITYFDGKFPGFAGQLHVVMVDVDVGDDDLYFKHFGVSGKSPI